MVDETAEALRAEIDHLRRPAQLVTDARVGAEIQKMIEELEKRLRELGLRGLVGRLGQASPARPPRGTSDLAFVKQLPDLASEGRDRERLTDEVDVGVEPPVVNDSIPVIPRGEQHAQLGTQVPRCLGELPAMHTAG